MKKTTKIVLEIVLAIAILGLVYTMYLQISTPIKF